MIASEYILVSDKALQNYVKATELNIRSKTASESSYYSDFKRFLEEIFPPKKGYLIQIESKQRNHNKPDITVKYNNVILFNIEAKKPNTPIEAIIKSKDNQRLNDQIYRYRKEGEQLLITDFLNVWLIDSEISNKPDIEQKFRFKCNLIEEKNNKFHASTEAVNNLQYLLSETCEKRLNTISNIKSLIEPLSITAKIIKKKAIYLLNSTTNELNGDQRIGYNYLKKILDDFKKSIFKEETEDINNLFSDLYAQTMVYGAFSAWIKFCQRGNKPIDYTIKCIGDYLPFGSFLRDLFLDLKNKTPHEFKSVFHEMEIKFQQTQYISIIKNTETMITTFYSDFLQLYDPITAKERGVVYTPHEIVEFMVDGIDFMIKRWLNIKNGIIAEKKDLYIKKQSSNNASLKQTKIFKKPIKKKIDRIRFLDPAAGTNAFACGLLHKAKEKFNQKYDNNFTLAQGAFKNWVINEFIENMYSFEILMAPYVLGNIRTFITLEELGLQLNVENYHLNSYLMNTLMTPPMQKIDQWMFNNQEIGREIKEALKIRQKREIFVIMGNPPYNLSSQNNCLWINDKIQDYKKDLPEKNKKILSDDYVKFIRFAQWKIEQVGTGIVAFITNNRYLEGQMFSIMRKSLRKTFDHIYIVNLHGDMRKKESGNPFDIRVGVSIIFMVRIDNNLNKNAAIHYMNLPENSKEEKFSKLKLGFQENQFILLPETPKNFFIQMDTTLLTRYEEFIPINLLFQSQPTSGIMIGREHLLVDTDESNLKENLHLFFNGKYDKLSSLKININDSKSWKKQSVLSKTNFNTTINSITEIQYRGMDYRHIAYDYNIVEGHRRGYIDQISSDNPAITITKSSRKSKFCTAFISNRIIEKCYMSITDTAYAFLLKKDNKSNIFKPILPFSITDEEVFYYIYAILFSPTYINRYDDFLRRSYPRIPFSIDEGDFKNMSDLGHDLANIHLLNIEISPKLQTADINSERWIINDFWYSESEKTLYFNKSNKSDSKKIPWIKGISKAMWDFSIGTILQISQFLKSRKYSPNRKWNSLQRGLSHKELLILLKICSAADLSLQKIELIDVLYKKIDFIENN